MMDIIFVEPEETDQTVQMRRLLAVWQLQKFNEKSKGGSNGGRKVLVKARLVREPYRRIRKTSGYAGGYLFVMYMIC
ncbi:TPA: hypothetical protein LC260_004808 [Salmonella enterica subsp. enterica serovar Eastbourne]|nr:hypothetical protein [Salmonella enterica subsp. enterica serovar Eastbourne]